MLDASKSDKEEDKKKQVIVWDEEAAKAGQPAVRPVQQGDIALLFRALTNVEYYEEALRRYGIDYYLVGGHAFYAQQEIYDLLSLLRAVDSTCDEVSLVGVLRSPFFGLLDQTLLWLAQEKGLAEGLFAEELPEELEDRCQNGRTGVGEEHIPPPFEKYFPVLPPDRKRRTREMISSQSANGKFLIMSGVSPGPIPVPDPREMPRAVTVPDDPVLGRMPHR